MKSLKAFKWSMIWTSIFVLVTTLWSEMSPSFKSFLAGITGHHWLTKSIFSTILFFGLYFFLPNKNQGKKETENPLNTAKTIFWIIVLVSIIIFLYYVFHFFG